MIIDFDYTQLISYQDVLPFFLCVACHTIVMIELEAIERQFSKDVYRKLVPLKHNQSDMKRADDERHLSNNQRIDFLFFYSIESKPLLFF